MNEDLRRELLALAAEAVPDPELRTRASQRFDLALARRMMPPRVIDRFARLLAEHRWPTEALAGAEGAEAAFELAMLCAPDDARLARRVLALLPAGAQKAMFADRMRLLEGRRQLCGTQYDWGEDGELRPLPIEDLGAIDGRRREVGLPPLGDDTRRIRLAATEANEEAPRDLAAHRAAQEQRAITAGWRTAQEIDEPVGLSPYDARWPAFFFDEARRLVELLGLTIAGIEHVGSTAVPGLDAKPIVDIYVGLRGGALTAEQRDALELVGYEPSTPGTWRLRGDKNFDVTFVEQGGRSWADALALRDFLRAHPAVARGYGEHKRRAIAAGARSAHAYGERKLPFLRNLLERARSWAASR